MSFDYGAAIGAATQIVGSLGGQALSQMDKDKAMQLIQDATDAYGKIQVPKLKELILQQQAKSGMSDIQDDPRYRDQQNAADSQLGDIIKGGGLTLADRAALNALRNRTQRAESEGRNAIKGDMERRGTLDSGAMLAMQLQGNQQTANRLAAGDEATAGQAQARAYQAIRDRAQFAGQGLDRDYRQKSDAARAQDAINAGNAAIMNTAAKYNAGLPQQNFNNQLDLTNSQSNAKAKLAAAVAGRAKDTQDTAQGVGNMAASAFKNMGSGSNSKPLDYSDGAVKNSENISFDQGTTDTSAMGGFADYPGSSSDALTVDDEEEQGSGFKAGQGRGRNF